MSDAMSHSSSDSPTETQARNWRDGTWSLIGDSVSGLEESPASPFSHFAMEEEDEELKGLLTEPLLEHMQSEVTLHEAIAELPLAESIETGKIAPATEAGLDNEGAQTGATAVAAVAATTDNSKIEGNESMKAVMMALMANTFVQLSQWIGSIQPTFARLKAKAGTPDRSLIRTTGAALVASTLMGILVAQVVYRGTFFSSSSSSSPDILDVVRTPCTGGAQCLQTTHADFGPDLVFNGGDLSPKDNLKSKKTKPKTQKESSGQKLRNKIKNATKTKTTKTAQEVSEAEFERTSQKVKQDLQARIEQALAQQHQQSEALLNQLRTELGQEKDARMKAEMGLRKSQRRQAELKTDFQAKLHQQRLDFENLLRQQKETLRKKQPGLSGHSESMNFADFPDFPDFADFADFAALFQNAFKHAKTVAKKAVRSAAEKIHESTYLAPDLEDDNEMESL